MRKVMVCLVIFILAAGTAAAQNAGQSGIGFKGGLNIGFSEESDTIKKIMADKGFGYDTKTKMGGLIGAYYYYAFVRGLSIQGEFNFMIDQGLNITITSGGSGTMTFRYDSLDIAAPLKYAFVNSDRARFGLAAGPVLSIPLSLKGEAEGPGGSENAEIETSGATFGICVGLFGGFQVAVGRVALDIRYLMDFNAVKDGAEDEVFKRRGIFIGLGYEFEF